MAFLLIKYYSQFRFFFFFLKIVDISMKTSFQKVEQCASRWNKEVSWKGEESPWQPKHECSFYSLVVYQFMFSPSLLCTCLKCTYMFSLKSVCQSEKEQNLSKKTSWKLLKVLFRVLDFSWQNSFVKSFVNFFAGSS